MTRSESLDGGAVKENHHVTVYLNNVEDEWKVASTGYARLIHDPAHEQDIIKLSIQQDKYIDAIVSTTSITSTTNSGEEMMEFNISGTHFYSTAEHQALRFYYPTLSATSASSEREQSSRSHYIVVFKSLEYMKEISLQMEKASNTTLETQPHFGPWIVPWIIPMTPIHDDQKEKENSEEHQSTDFPAESFPRSNPLWKGSIVSSSSSSSSSSTSSTNFGGDKMNQHRLPECKADNLQHILLALESNSTTSVPSEVMHVQTVLSQELIADKAKYIYDLLTIFETFEDMEDTETCELIFLIVIKMCK